MNQLRAAADAFQPERTHQCSLQLSGELHKSEVLLITSALLLVKTENISVHKQNANHDGNRAQALKGILETLFRTIKKCTLLHHRSYMVEHKVC